VVSGGRIFIPDVNLLICTATAFEASVFTERISSDASIRVIQTGVGPVNAAHATTVAILEDRPDAIIVCGVGGAYPSAGLALGEVVCAADEIYGDLGAQSPAGFLDMKALGFAVVRGSQPLFNELPMQIFPVQRRVRIVTVSTCTGTDVAAHELEVRTGGLVENMEGAAVAHVAHLHGVAVGEVRGISNIVTNRDVSTWRLRDASDAAQRAVIEWIDDTRRR
jgi:futalosine hydrolase